MPVGEEVTGLASIFGRERYPDCLTFLPPSYLIQKLLLMQERGSICELLF